MSTPGRHSRVGPPSDEHWRSPNAKQSRVGVVLAGIQGGQEWMPAKSTPAARGQARA